jgi:adenylosuccinate lyase
MLVESRARVMLPALDTLVSKLRAMAHELAEVAMLARTHGQAATPTTLGKELANDVNRLQSARETLAQVRLKAKFNGAVGNYNAH